jgi:hypothetical protein
MAEQSDLANWVEGIIREFINTSPENTLQNEANEKAWGDPLVGFSRGDDPLYEDYKIGRASCRERVLAMV